MDFHYPYFTILAIAIIAGIAKFGQLTKSSKVFLLLLTFTLSFEVFAFNYAYTHPSNYFYYNLFIPIQYSIIAIGFYFEIRKKWVLLSIPLIIIYVIGSSFFNSILENFNTNALILNFFLSIVLSLVALYALLQIETDKNFIHFPIFWVSCGFLLFCTLNLFVFGTFNFFVKAGTNNLIDEIFNNIRIYSNYVLYSIFIIVFLIKQHSISDKFEK